MSQWADRHRVLDPVFSNGGGPWRTSDTPYLREIMDSASCRWVRRLTLVGPTQIGKTEAANNILGYFIHQQPSPCMLVMPRNDDTKLAGKRRIRPMIAASPALAAELTDSAHDVSVREIAFRRSILYLRAAQSPADLASVPVRLVLGDETEKWPEWTGSEANPLSLVTERTRTFLDHLIVLTSTPRLRDGLILREFERGDRRRLHMRCPGCHEWVVFTWGQVKWAPGIKTSDDMRDSREAWFECPYCKHRVDDGDRIRMIGRGEWVPAASDPDEWVSTGRLRDRAEHRSYHLWAAYSPWLTWWKIVAEFLRSKDEPSDLMNFVNSWLAEPWEESATSNAPEEIAACIASHRMFDVPEKVLVLTAAVDVQKDYLAWCVWGWGMDEESWMVAAGECRDFEELGTRLFAKLWGQKKPMPIRICLVDARYRSGEVSDWWRKWKSVVRQIKGVERDGPVPFGVLKIDRHPSTGVPIPGGCSIWTVNSAMFKDLVSARFQATGSKGRIHLAADCSPEFLKQLTSEHKVRTRSKGKVVDRWVLRPGHRRNEAWDLAVYNAAAARMIRVETLRSDVGVRPQAAAAPAAATSRSDPASVRLDDYGFPEVVP